MERWKADLIDRIIREDGRALGSYGIAIRLQQQLGMSWEEATAISGYDGRPRIYKPRPQSPQPYVHTPKDLEIIRAYQEKMRRHLGRRERDPIERLHELIEALKVQKQLENINQELLDGRGAVDQEVQIMSYYKRARPRGMEVIGKGNVGVMMIRMPYKTRIAWGGLNPRDYNDFASIRVGVIVPTLWTEPSDYPDFDEEKVGVQIRESNLQSNYLSPDGAEAQPLWYESGHWSTSNSSYFEFANRYPEKPDPKDLSHLLREKINPRILLSLANPLLPPSSTSTPQR